MKFEDIIGKKIAVNCKTKEEAKEFIRIAYENGYHWLANKTIKATNYEVYEADTCYNISSNRRIYFGTKKWYNSDYYRIINFNEISINSVKQSYHLDIKRKNNKTIAILKDVNGKYIRHAKAACSPDDEYDYEVGKKIALSRLFNIESVDSDTSNKK